MTNEKMKILLSKAQSDALLGQLGKITQLEQMRSVAIPAQIEAIKQANEAFTNAMVKDAGHNPDDWAGCNVVADDGTTVFLEMISKKQEE